MQPVRPRPDANGKEQSPVANAKSDYINLSEAFKISAIDVSFFPSAPINVRVKGAHGYENMSNRAAMICDGKVTAAIDSYAVVSCTLENKEVIGRLPLSRTSFVATSATENLGDRLELQLEKIIHSRDDTKRLLFSAILQFTKPGKSIQTISCGRFRADHGNHDRIRISEKSSRTCRITESRWHTHNNSASFRNQKCHQGSYKSKRFLY